MNEHLSNLIERKPATAEYLKTLDSNVNHQQKLVLGHNTTTNQKMKAQTAFVQ